MRPLAPSRLGANAALERYADEAALRQTLRGMQEAGLRTIRQRLPGESSSPRRATIVGSRGIASFPSCDEQGLALIAVLDTSPTWATTTVGSRRTLRSSSRCAGLRQFRPRPGRALWPAGSAPTKSGMSPISRLTGAAAPSTRRLMWRLLSAASAAIRESGPGRRDYRWRHGAQSRVGRAQHERCAVLARDLPPGSGAMVRRPGSQGLWLLERRL